MDRKKILAALCIALGIAFIAVPFYYHYSGKQETEQLMEDFTDSVEEKQDEETTGETEEQSTIGESDAAIFSEGDVIAILEIEALGIRYPVMEGATSDNLNKGIGHIIETAGTGDTGNCVLAGHNGSRYGEFFTHLSGIEKGDTVRILKNDGTWLTYVVTDTYTVDPYDNSIKDQGEERELTLFTCAEKGTMRFVVRCLLSEEAD